jgi:hypothetical protein
MSSILQEISPETTHITMKISITSLFMPFMKSGLPKKMERFKPKNLRVLGLAQHKEYPTTIGVELEGQIFAPLLDVQGNIRRLVNLESRTVTSSYEFTAFGEELQAHSSAELVTY